MFIAFGAQKALDRVERLSLLRNTLRNLDSAKLLFLEFNLLSHPADILGIPSLFSDAVLMVTKSKAWVQVQVVLLTFTFCCQSRRSNVIISMLLFCLHKRQSGKAHGHHSAHL